MLLSNGLGTGVSVDVECAIEWIVSNICNAVQTKIRKKKWIVAFSVPFPAHDIYKLVTPIRTKDKLISQEVLATYPYAFVLTYPNSSSSTRNDDEQQKNRWTKYNTIKNKIPVPLAYSQNIMHSMTTNQPSSLQSTQKMHIYIYRLSATNLSIRFFCKHFLNLFLLCSLFLYQYIVFALIWCNTSSKNSK